MGIRTIKKNFRLKFIKPRLSLQSIEELSEDIPLFTNELHVQNDFYGHAAILKKFVGFKKSYIIKAAIEHGIFFAIDFWDMDVNAPFPAIFTMSNERKLFLEKVSDKKVFAIGPYINYAEHALSEKQLINEKKRLGNNMLIFPAHSSHRVDTNYNFDILLDQINKIGKDFDSIRICLYWKDILRGFDKFFKEKGFECVSAGHIFDPMFLPRLKSIIELSTATASNLFGTHVGYSIFMNKPHYLFAQQVDFIGPHEDIGDGIEDKNLEFERIFGQLCDKITQEQYDYINKFWGLTEIKPKEEVKAILFEIEEDYKKQFTEREKIAK